MGTDISLYTTAIRDLPKGESVRDAIINAIKILATQGTYASTLGYHPLSDFVVYSLDETKPATNWQETKQNLKDMVDRINFGYTQAEQPTVVHQNELGPTGSFNSTDAEPEETGKYSFNKLAKCKKDIRDAINEAWRNTPSSGTHGSDEYLVLSSDPFEDYPNFVSLIGVGEGFTNSVSTLDVTENGVYNAPNGTGYDKVNVNVQTQKIQAMPSEITANGTYAASNFGLDGFSFVTVRVPFVDPDDPSYNPQTAYDPTAWYQQTGEQVVARFFYKNPDTGKNEKLGEQTLAYGQTPSLIASSYGHSENYIPHEDGYKFARWNPDLKPLTHNEDYEAVFEEIEQVDSSTGEILDTWEQIAANYGADYPVGSWKVMNFGTVRRWLGPDIVTGEDFYQKVEIGRVVMIKVAGPNEDDETTSTWISEQAVDLGGGGWHISCPKAMVEHAYSKETDDIFSFKDTDLCDFLNGRRHSQVHSIYEHLNPYVVGKMKSVDKKSMGIQVRATTNSTYNYKTLYFKSHAVDTYRCTFWIPSSDEIFHKKTNWANAREYGYYRSNTAAIDGSVALASAVRKFLDCDAPNYSDFFFGLNGEKAAYDYSDWFGYNPTSYTQGNAYKYAFRPSWSQKVRSGSYWCTAPMRTNVGYGNTANYWLNDSGYRIGTRDIAFDKMTDTLDENNEMVISTNTATYLASGLTQNDADLDKVKINVPHVPLKFGWTNNGTGRYYVYAIAANGWTPYLALYNATSFGNNTDNGYYSPKNYTENGTVIGRVRIPIANVSRDMVSKSDRASVGNVMDASGNITKNILHYIGFSF